MRFSPFSLSQVRDDVAAAEFLCVQVEILHVQQPSHLARAVVPDTRTALSEPAVGDVELMPVTPRTALLDLRPLIIHVTRGEIVLDVARERTVLKVRRRPLPRLI